MSRDARVTRTQVQLVVVALIAVVWVIALVLAVFVDSIMLKAVTPVATMMFGWLFAERIAKNGNGEK